ncbi:peptidase inhibitor family I36 protein [Streptomyces sp. NPDC004111]|uniref:peptidase inhibitor family I36 protein n=1 Tax=Streptomyces sp. NPDC004111 TaxID=3364690 RepID=UPI00369A4783
MLKFKNKVALAVATAGLSFTGLLATAGTAGAAAQADGYNRCPSGRACFFSDWNGTGSFGYPSGCGTQYLGQWAGTVSSIKTHGNAVRLLDSKQNSVGYVPAWTSTNLSAAENDKAHWIWVIC